MSATPYNIDLLIERAPPAEAGELAIWALKNSKSFSFLPLCSSEFFESVHGEMEEQLTQNAEQGWYDEWLPDFVKTISTLSYLSQQSKVQLYTQALKKDLSNVFPVMSLQDLGLVFANMIENGCDSQDGVMFGKAISLMDDKQKEKLMGDLDLPFALAGEYGHREEVSLVCQHLPELLDHRVATISKMLASHKETLASLSLALGIPIDIENLHQQEFSKMHHGLLFALPDIQMKVIRTYLPFLNQKQMQLLHHKASYLPGFPPELTARLEKMMLTKALVHDQASCAPVAVRRKI